jgi:hypothetical protein
MLARYLDFCKLTGNLFVVRSTAFVVFVNCRIGPDRLAVTYPPISYFAHQKALQVCTG